MTTLLWPGIVWLANIALACFAAAEDVEVKLVVTVERQPLQGARAGIERVAGQRLGEKRLGLCRPT